MEDDGARNSIVARADALMQRRRQSAGQRPPEAEELPVLTEIVDPDADLPVLGDVQPPLPEEKPEAPALDPAVLDILGHELARRVRERIAAELPSLIEAALQSTLSTLTRDIRDGISGTTEDAIRDFLAEREKLARIQGQR